MKALLIIDMQNICFKPETPRYEAEKVMGSINILSRRLRQEGQLNSDSKITAGLYLLYLMAGILKRMLCIPHKIDYKQKYHH